MQLAYRERFDKFLVEIRAVPGTLEEYAEACDEMSAELADEAEGTNVEKET